MLKKFKKKKENDTLRVLAKRMAEKFQELEKLLDLMLCHLEKEKVIHEVVNKYPDLDTFR